MKTITLTDSQVENLIEFFDLQLIQNIRNDSDIDNMDYLVDMCEIYKKLKERGEGE